MALKVVIATRNRGKISEIKTILKDLSLELLSLDDFPQIKLPPEEGNTFEENALAKARYVASITDLPALADDSGLEVDALNGRPGVCSARYAGEGSTDRENYLKLLSELKGIGDRRARFRCVIAFVDPRKGDRTFEGVFEGVVAEAPRGHRGFGYDPVFLVPHKNRTVAELTDGEKNSISHRAGALKRFREWMEGAG
ncbi:MAG: XTP/dITP diphosphatase [Deltaproteobacteria bacterium]|nr:XTP/dITP diphosphatase [Deltaproteobacteria bacterium]